MPLSEGIASRCKISRETNKKNKVAHAEPAFGVARRMPGLQQDNWRLASSSSKGYYGLYQISEMGIRRLMFLSIRVLGQPVHVYMQRMDCRLVSGGMIPRNHDGRQVGPVLHGKLKTQLPR